MIKQIFILFCFALTAISADAANFYSLSPKTARGKPYPFEQLRGKVVVIANTASKCGFTPQYKELQTVSDSYSGKGVVVLGMPSNSFSQENLNSAKAAEFCELNHGVKFTILEKSDVKGSASHPLFKFLTKNAPKTGDVMWNFEKFIVDGTGNIVARFSSQTSPNSPEFKTAIEGALAKK